jgi:death-on-curing protein
VTANTDPLGALLGRIAFVLQEPVDFSRTDAEGRLAQVRLLTAAATYLNVMAVADFGGRLGTARAEGLVEQVVAAAFQTFGGVDPHADPFDRAAMLLRGITQGHPFNDGNKRTGFLTATYYLRLVGHPLPIDWPEDDVVTHCLDVSAGRIRSVEAIAAFLRRVWGASDQELAAASGD